jgi:hypothetical protein
MRGAIPPLPQYASMAWCSVKSTGTTLPLPLDYVEHISFHTRSYGNCRVMRSGDTQRTFSMYVTSFQATMSIVYFVRVRYEIIAISNMALCARMCILIRM